nr:hypothetical protein [Paraburkholderia sp. BL9I2N2]
MKQHVGFPMCESQVGPASKWTITFFNSGVHRRPFSSRHFRLLLCSCTSTPGLWRLGSRIPPTQQRSRIGWPQRQIANGVVDAFVHIIEQ